MDLYDEAIKESSDTKKFVAASDPRVTECPTHLMAVMSDIVKAAITKHSIRATSEQVGVFNCFIINTYYTYYYNQIMEKWNVVN